MSGSAYNPKRLLIADTDTPAAEITISNGLGEQVYHATNRVEAEFDPGLYELSFRVGDEVREMLVKLPPGDEPFVVETPRLPFETVAPITRRGRDPSPNAARARDLSLGQPEPLGEGSQLLLFVDTPDSVVPPGLEIRRFDGNQVATVQAASVDDPFVGRLLGLEPGSYLLRWGELEQSVVTLEGWQTQVYLQFRDGQVPPALSDAAIMTCRVGVPFDPDDAEFRAVEVVRRALAAGRGRAVDDESLIGSVLSEKFDNPMLGILAAHLMLQSGKLSTDMLKRMVDRLRRLVPGHPDVDSLHYAADEARAPALRFAQPPMLRSSWQQILQHAGNDTAVIPRGSYSAQMASSLWGDGPWLTWTKPPPADIVASSLSPSDALAHFVSLALAGGLLEKLPDSAQLSPGERIVAGYLRSLLDQASYAQSLSVTIDGASALSGLMPLYRKVKASDLQSSMSAILDAASKPELLSKQLGLPLTSLSEAAVSLLHKMGVDEKPSLFAQGLTSALSQAAQGVANFITRSGGRS